MTQQERVLLASWGRRARQGSGRLRGQPGRKAVVDAVSLQSYSWASGGGQPRLLLYRTNGGHEPFLEWLEGLKDNTSRGRVQARLDRLVQGNPGDSRELGGGLSELRLEFGPGYRIYFGRDGLEVILLLGGGDKATQTGDIDLARKHWGDYLVRRQG